MGQNRHVPGPALETETPEPSHGARFQTLGSSRRARSAYVEVYISGYEDNEGADWNCEGGEEVGRDVYC